MVVIKIKGVESLSLSFTSSNYPYKTGVFRWSLLKIKGVESLSLSFTSSNYPYNIGVVG